MVQMDFLAANHVLIVGLIDKAHRAVIYGITQFSCFMNDVMFSYYEDKKSSPGGGTSWTSVFDWVRQSAALEEWVRQSLPSTIASLMPLLRLQITLDDFLCAVNAYGRLESEEAQVADLREAFLVLDESRRGKVQSIRLLITLHLSHFGIS